jgi:hypothetical protein
MTPFRALSEQELRTSLGLIAADHQPDRTAMLKRIERYRAGPPVAERPPAGPAMRLAGSALAVTTILGAGGLARWALADGPSPTVGPVATASGPTVVPTAASLPLVRADGSIDRNSDDSVGRSALTLEVREPLTAVRLTVRVAPAAGLTDQGATHDATGATIHTTVVRERDTLAYSFELAAGTTLVPGTYVFTARYTHDEGGRAAGDDTYRVTATTADAAAPVDLRGDFS